MSLDEAIDDYDLSICLTCAAQYSSSSLRPYILGNESSGDGCPICLDDRQYLKGFGQKWTSWREIERESQTELVEDARDKRIVRIVTKPSVAIGQTPFLVRTTYGSIIWDCGPYLSESAVAAILAQTKPLLGIAISHPHFFSSSVTWARKLGCKVFVCAEDREWFMRNDERAEKVIDFWEGDRKVFGPGLEVVRCGGHFSGSSVLYWNRALQPYTPDGCPSTGVIFCSDTFMVAPDRKTISFMYSIPNQIPLPPQAVLHLWNQLRPLSFDDVYGAWEDRYCFGGGCKQVLESARRFVRMEGWEEGRWVFEG